MSQVLLFGDPHGALVPLLRACQEEAEALRSRVRHQALPDADGLRRTWRFIADEVATRLVQADRR